MEGRKLRKKCRNKRKERVSAKEPTRDNIKTEE